MYDENYISIHDNFKKDIHGNILPWTPEVSIDLNKLRKELKKLESQAENIFEDAIDPPIGEMPKIEYI